MYQEQEKNRDPIGRLIQDKKPNYLDKRIRISEDFKFYGVTKTQAGNAEIAISLKINLKDGQQLVIQYHELISPMRYDGVSTIKLSTSHLSVEIKGKNLSPLLDYLAEHRLMWIKEPESDWGEVGDGEVKIEAIVISED
jgi:hypothetical protein